MNDSIGKNVSAGQKNAKWHLLTDIPFSLDKADFLAEMRIKPGSSREVSCLKLLDQACDLARPRAVYLLKHIEDLDETGMTVDGLRFRSSLFMPRFKAGDILYFFLATSGAEISEWACGFRDDLLRSYWADCLAEKALRTAVAALEEALRPFIADKYLSAMHPGSLTEWALTDQEPLFMLAGSAAPSCGVSLNRHCVMQPQKSVSGFYFSSADEYYDCELCPRLRCPNRRTAFTGHFKKL